MENNVSRMTSELCSVDMEYGRSTQRHTHQRVNRSIIAAIRTYNDEDQTTWDVHISAIASVLRNATRASTTQSSYFTVFGQHMVQQAIASGEIDVLPPTDARGEINKKVRSMSVATCPGTESTNIQHESE